MTRIGSKALIILTLAIILLNMFSNIIYGAVEININKVLLQKIGEADEHLKYYRDDEIGKGYRYLTCSIVGYYNDEGKFLPSYCMNKNLKGAEDNPYNVKIDSLLNNDKVWRVIKNGYPNKNMGLSNYNAYAVTKWAVYCILGESDINDYYAEEDDDIAVDMLRELKKLVSIGKDKNKGTQDEDPLKIQNIGEFKEDGDYYSQEYKVTSSVDFSEYKIGSKKGIPEGGFVANTKGENKTNFKRGENFKVMVPKDKLNKDINIKIKIDAQCKAYVILEGKTTVTDTQNYVLAAGEYVNANQEVQLKKNTNTGKIKINKTDSETSLPVSGVEFELRNQEEKVISKAITDLDGTATFEGLYQDSYKIIETKSNKDYIITQSEFDVDVTYNTITTQNIENEHKRGNLKIYKVDEDNNKIGLGNVKFELYSEELKKVIGTYMTNADGEIYIEHLRTGKYKLKEKGTNKWYNLIDDFNIEVQWEGDVPQTEITVKNELKKGKVKIIKVDKDDRKIRLEGVTFNVMNEKGEILETITTDSNGEASTSRYAVRDYDRLYIQEKETKKGYKLNNEIVEVELKANEVTNIELENEVKKGRIKVIKVDKDNNEIKLKGVKFEVYDEKKNVIETLTTDSNGEAMTKNLPISEKYTLKEVKTNKDYVLSEKTEKIELKEDEVKEIKVENEKKKGKIKVIKVDEENNEIKLEGVEFNILNRKGEIVESIKTNLKGEAISCKLPIDEKYTIQETKTLENYVLTDKIQTIELKENETKEIKVENRKIKGKIRIIKTSRDDNPITGEKKGTPISGVSFEIYDCNKKKVDLVTTDKNGIAETKLLEKGSYCIKEIATNEWYVLNDQIFETQIIEDGQIVDLDIKNESKKPKVDIEKTGPDKAEVGKQIEYDISVRNTGNTVFDKFTWEDIIPTDYIKVTKFETGTYNQDLRYNLYYKTNLSDDNYILLMEDLNTTENYIIDFEKELADNEYVTELKLEFEKVDIDFCSNDNPHLFAKVKENTKNNDIFENIAKISGEINGYKVKDTSRWKTKAIKILPVTGF
ncbi:MAG: Cys-Gln thioester bond-forming surface protein [Clostridia bacterium]|nr:Cys-Gln thioester bond-forming surface protein [Clostridia bacterium]